MIQYSLHGSEYLEAAKHYHKIWETPSVKEDEPGKGKEVRAESILDACLNLTVTTQALEHVAYYLVLAPHDNEQSDMLHRVYQYPALLKLSLQ